MVTVEEMQFYYFMYHVSFGLFYYLLLIFGTVMYWIVDTQHVSAQQRVNDLVLFGAIMMCLHPVLVTVASVVVAVQHYVVQPFVHTYEDFLHRHGLKL